MTDNHLLIVAAIVMAAVAEFIAPFVLVAVGWHNRIPSPFVRLFVTWPLGSLVLYAILYIAYSMFFHKSP
jgi:hypothetical protein